MDFGGGVGVGIGFRRVGVAVDGVGAVGIAVFGGFGFRRVGVAVDGVGLGGVDITVFGGFRVDVAVDDRGDAVMRRLVADERRAARQSRGAVVGRETRRKRRTEAIRTPAGYKRIHHDDLGRRIVAGEPVVGRGVCVVGVTPGERHRNAADGVIADEVEGRHVGRRGARHDTVAVIVFDDNARTAEFGQGGGESDLLRRRATVPAARIRPGNPGGHASGAVGAVMTVIAFCAVADLVAGRDIRPDFGVVEDAVTVGVRSPLEQISAGRAGRGGAREGNRAGDPVHSVFARIPFQGAGVESVLDFLGVEDAIGVSIETGLELNATVGAVRTGGLSGRGNESVEAIGSGITLIPLKGAGVGETRNFRDVEDAVGIGVQTGLQFHPAVGAVGASGLGGDFHDVVETVGADAVGGRALVERSSFRSFGRVAPAVKVAVPAVRAVGAVRTIFARSTLTVQNGAETVLDAIAERTRIVFSGSVAQTIVVSVPTLAADLDGRRLGGDSLDRRGLLFAPAVTGGQRADTQERGQKSENQNQLLRHLRFLLPSSSHQDW